MIDDDEITCGHRPLARKTGDDWYYYLYNAHGDVIGLTDESGTVVNSYAYSPWGKIRTQTESVKNPIKYAGEYYDDELDMLYLRARYYDPQIGRFISLPLEGRSVPVASVQHRPNRQVRRVNITDFLAFLSRGSLVWNGTQAVPYGFTENRIEFIHRARNKPHKNN